MDLDKICSENPFGFKKYLIPKLIFKPFLQFI